MCDYCDCRSHPEIAALSGDHDVLLGLLASLRRAVDADDADGAAALVDSLHGLLDHHAGREERGVFAQLTAADVEPGYVAAFEADHARIHALVDRSRTAAWREAALELVAVLGSHIAREESDLFPAAHQLLEPWQWDAIAATDAAHRPPSPVLAVATRDMPT